MRLRHMRLNTWTVILALTAFGLLAWVVANRLIQNASLGAGHAVYAGIRPGMTVVEIDRLMRAAGPCMGGQSGTSMVYHSLDGTFMIAVVFLPGPSRPTSWPRLGWRIPDDWVSSEKQFVELGRGGLIDDSYVGLGLRPQRVVDRE